MFFDIPKRIFKLLFLLFTLAGAVTGQTVVINEFMASNVLGIVDEDGDHEDWIELYNNTSNPINLENYTISDDLGLPDKWVFPSIIIQPGEFLLIFASGKDREQPNLHTNFSISSNGEPLLLSNPNGIIISFIPPVELTTNVSYGCFPNGQPQHNYFTNPTPNSANQNDGFEENLSLPALNYPSGLYIDSFYLKATHTNPDAEIRYTLDGSIPDSSSPLFPDSLLISDISQEPDNISVIPTTPLSAPTWYRWYAPMQTTFKGTNIRLKAFSPNGMSLDTRTEMYFVNDTIFDRYQIPMVSITLPQSSLFGSQGIYTNFNQRGLQWERPAHFKYFEPDGELAFDSDIGLRIHGGNSRRYALKSFRLYFRNRYGSPQFEHPLLLDKEINIHERLIMRNSGSDWARTYFRDAFVQDILTEFTSVERQGLQPAITFVNGEYWGILNFRGRYDDNYLRLAYGVSNIDLLQNTNSVVVGSNSHYNNLINYMVSNDLDEPLHYEEIKNRMDIENFRDYHILQIFSMNTDQPGKNVRFWKSSDLDNKWRWMWFDLDDTYILGPHCNFDRNGFVFCVGLDSISSPTVNPSSSWPSWAPNGPNQTRPLRTLLSSTAFKHDFINRFADLLNTAFTPDYLFNKIDSISDFYTDIMEEHYMRWHRPEPEFRQDHLDYLYEFSANRQQYVREHMVDFFELTGNYNLTLEIGSGEGFVHLNTITIDTVTPTIQEQVYPWTGIYFNDVPIHLTANPHPGYFFSHWEGYVSSNQDEIEVSADEDITIIAHFLPDSLAYLEEDKQITFVVFPNPATDIINVLFDDNTLLGGTATLLNLSGQIVKSETLSTNEFKIDLQGIQRGAYVLRLVSPYGDSVYKKVIVQ